MKSEIAKNNSPQGVSFPEEEHEQKTIWLYPVVVFVLTLGISIAVSFFIGNLIDQSRSAQFSSEVEQINDSITNRLEIYTNALLGGKGLFDASNDVARDEWRAYVDSLEIQESYPGIQGLGYSQWVPSEELAEHEASISAEGFPEYHIRPVGDRQQYTSIIYLEPFDIRNKQAFGFDMYQEITRKTAMDRAVLTGKPALSGKVTLVQEIDDDVQSGFLIYVPVYIRGTSPESAVDRFSTVQGFVYSPFRMNDFIKGTTPPDIAIDVEIFDGSDTRDLSDNRKMYSDVSAEDMLFRNIKVITFGGHSWTVVYTADSKYGLDLVQRMAPTAMLILGILVSILLSVVFYTFNNRRAKAIALAKSMTDDLRKRTDENEAIRQKLELANVDLEKQSQALSEKVAEMEKFNQLMVGRELKMIELKKKLKKSDADISPE